MSKMVIEFGKVGKQNILASQNKVTNELGNSGRLVNEVPSQFR